MRVCEETLRKRVDEFSKTPAAALTWSKFQELMQEDQKPNALVALLGDEMDPPSFTLAHKQLDGDMREALL